VPSFFFQAEDGIRGLIVTGVQTCALPIFASRAAAGAVDQIPSRTEASVNRPSTASGRSFGSVKALPVVVALDAPPNAASDVKTRSEERRVGKEWRCRGGPEHRRERQRVET